MVQIRSVFNSSNCRGISDFSVMNLMASCLPCNELTRKLLIAPWTNSRYSGTLLVFLAIVQMCKSLQAVKIQTQ